MKFDFGEIILKDEAALIGRPNGENCLKKAIKKGYDFEKMEKESDIITVVFPKDVISINESFFLGFFENMIRRAGSKDKFFGKYHFDTSDHIQEKIKRHVEHGLLQSSQNDILGIRTQ